MDTKKIERTANILITLKNIIKSQENKKGTENYKKENKTQKIIHKRVTCTYLSIVTLNVNRLYALIKGYRMAEQIRKKQDPYICLPQETHFRSKDTHTESEGMEKHISCKQK